MLLNNTEQYITMLNMTEQHGTTGNLLDGEADHERLRLVLGSLPGRNTIKRRIASMADTIRAARMRGVEWAEIVQGLAKVGLTRPDGRPLAISTVADAMRSLDGLKPTKANHSQKEEKRTAAVHDPPPKPRHQPPGVAGGFEMPQEVEAYLSQADAGSQADAVDELLKDLKNGKS